MKAGGRDQNSAKVRTGEHAGEADRQRRSSDEETRSEGERLRK